LIDDRCIQYNVLEFGEKIEEKNRPRVPLVLHWTKIDSPVSIAFASINGLPYTFSAIVDNIYTKTTGSTETSRWAPAKVNDSFEFSF
jgi:hypothetical protein